MARLAHIFMDWYDNVEHKKKNIAESMAKNTHKTVNEHVDEVDGDKSGAFTKSLVNPEEDEDDAAVAVDVAPEATGG